MIKLLLKLDGDSRQLGFSQDVITIGRSSDNILALSDKKASRKHARIEKIGNEYRLSDLESGNGTTVNGKPVVFHSLAKGDEISVGLTTLTVVDMDTPPPVAAPALEAPSPPPAEPVAAAAAPTPVAAEPAPARPVTHRADLRLHRRSNVLGNLVAAVIALAVLGALVIGVKYVADSKGQTTAAAHASKPAADAAPSAAFVAEADAALADLRQRAEGPDVSDALIAEVTEKGEKYAGAYERGKATPFSQLRDQLSQNRDAKFREKHAEAAGRVDAALLEHRYGDAIEAIKALRSTVDKSSEGAVSSLLSKVTSEIHKDYRSVVGEGRKLEGQERHADAAEYYKQQAPRFKGTEFYKDLAERPELILAYAKAIAEAEANKPVFVPKPPEPEKPAVIVKAPEPLKSPDPVVAEKPKENPIAKAPEPVKPTGKPATNKGAPPPPPPPKGAPPPPPPPGSTQAPPPPSGNETAKADPKEKEDPKPAKAAPTGALKGPPKLPDNACDCKKIIKGVYCETCKKELQPEDLRRALCKKCEEKPKKIDLCVKRQYQADCHPNKVSDKPVS